MIRSFFASSLVLLCFSIFESAVLSNITFLPSLPDLSLLCVLYFSINNGKIMGETTGFVSGLFLDFLSACPLGLNCLLRTILGYLTGILKQTFNTEVFFIPMILAFAGTVAKVGVTLFISVLFPAIVYSYHVVSFEFFFELAMNIILAPLVFKFLGIFKNSLVVKTRVIY